MVNGRLNQSLADICVKSLFESGVLIKYELFPNSCLNQPILRGHCGFVLIVLKFSGVFKKLKKN